MKIFDLFREWKTALREKRIERLTAHAGDLEEGQQHDLLFLQARGFVRAHATGESITKIHASIENLIRKRLFVRVEAGTYFISKGGHQNMVARKPMSFHLPACASKQVQLDAACINASLPIPGDCDRFQGVRKASTEVCRFLEAAGNADPMVVQAAVWALTDGYSGDQVQTTLMARDQDGNTRPAVSDAHVAEARRILQSLGISTRL